MKIDKTFKIIIWGHKLHSHTHSYIHFSFYKTFKHLGYDTYWFDDKDDISNFDFKNSIFIVEGQVDKKIPLRDDCFYILHNCYDSKYKPLFEKGLCTNLQVYTDSVLKYKMTKLEDCIYADYEGRCIYIPWATDLLPHEIEANKPSTVFRKDSKIINWIGTIGAGEFGNINEISSFIKSCQANGITFKKSEVISFEDNVKLIQESYMAPTIVGTWQHTVNYIPCRIFKNISYGQMGLTNSERVYELFQGKIIHNNNTGALFYDAKKYLTNMPLSELHSLMDFVAQKHTYINRINTILDFINKL